MSVVENLHIHRTWVISLSAVAAIVGGLSLFNSKKREPQSLDEVLDVVNRLGLYTRGDRSDGHVQGRLIISEAPMDFASVADFTLVLPDGPRLQGKVALYWRGLPDDRALPTQSRQRGLWGKYFVHGDPRLIQRLREFGAQTSE